MTLTDTSIRQLLVNWRDTADAADERGATGEACSIREFANEVESALTTLATQIREEDARIAEGLAESKPWDISGASNDMAAEVAAAIRARQEKVK